MPRPPPRPLCLPELVTNPQARAEYIQSHPPIYSPSNHTSTSRFPSPLPSPSSTTGLNSHRASAATLASSSPPITPASTHTSLSVHNATWITELSKRASGFAGGLMPAGSAEDGKSGTDAESYKPRASWSSALANTRSWFGGKNASLTPDTLNGSREIKLSPSMIAAHATTLPSPRPLSSPLPSSGEPIALSPTGSTFSPRMHRVGSGLRYYTERNPAPVNARKQIFDPIDIQDHDLSRPILPVRFDDPSGATPTPTTFAGVTPKLATDATSQHALDLKNLKDEAMSREIRGPLSPPPTPPMDVRNSDVPDIRISSGSG